MNQIGHEINHDNEDFVIFNNLKTKEQKTNKQKLTCLFYVFKVMNKKKPFLNFKLINVLILKEIKTQATLNLVKILSQGTF